MPSDCADVLPIYRYRKIICANATRINSPLLFVPYTHPHVEPWLRVDRAKFLRISRADVTEFVGCPFIRETLEHRLKKWPNPNLTQMSFLTYKLEAFPQDA